jgi:two-component system, OmpR family, phosphate regulon sensor histidine kinase PhoR
VSLGYVAVLLAVLVSLLVSEVRDQLPAVFDYRIVQVGLLLLVIAFTAYAFERERKIRRLADEITAGKVEAARMQATVETLDRVQTERDTFSALLLASADGIVVVDRSRRIERVNPAVQALLARGETDLVGRSCDEVLGCGRGGTAAEPALGCGSCPFSRVLENGVPVTDHVFDLRQPEGRHAWLSGAYAPVRDAAGGIGHVIGALRDVTRTKEIEQLQQDLVSIASHEIRAPLAAIKGFAATLLVRSDRMTPDSRRQFLEGVDQQADRLTALVDDLLEVQSIDSQRLKIDRSEVDLVALTREVVDHFRSKWGDRLISIDATPGLPLVHADRSKMDEVLVNLIDNAVKYSPAGGDIRIALAKGPGSVEISIEDEGIGIPPEEASLLFRKFHRISSPETADIGGTGLGLYIVKSLVEAHGGRVHLRSNPGVGSIFTVSLPVALPGVAGTRDGLTP